MARGRADGDEALVEELTTAECWDRLDRSHVGRLALTDAAGRPEIFPVNFLCHEGQVYFRTARGSKLSHIAQYPDVAFEVDGTEGEVGWSVVLRGRGQRVNLDAEIRGSGIMGLRTDIPTVKPFVVRLVPASVTGRRFRTDVVTPLPHESNPSAPEGTGDRAGRPRPIPHRPPLNP